MTTQYVCQECGKIYSKWIGKCEGCNSWNTLVEEIVNVKLSSSARKKNINDMQVFDLSNIDSTDVARYKIGIGEVDRVLGGGLVMNSVILFYGDPGIGKSTLLLQICDFITQNSDFKCLYISAEESLSQIKIRADRLGIKSDNIKMVMHNELSDIRHVAAKFNNFIMIVDSIQTIYDKEINSTPGTVTQVKACTFELVQIAKKYNCIIIIVGHVTKDGQIAGPKLLEHMVDVVISFEGEHTKQYRIIRAIKNRYGSNNEIGIFTMTNIGLHEVSNPSNIFVSTNVNGISGSCISVCNEGSRSIMVEVQSLVAHSFMVNPKRAALGWDTNRLSMIVAILSSRLNIKLADQEIYLNIAGGLKINETGIDLAVVAAIISSKYQIIIPHNAIFIGEVGLLGELRSVSHIESRINEAVKFGSKKIFLPNDKKLLEFEIISKYKNNHNVEIITLDNINKLFYTMRREFEKIKAS